MNYRVTFRENLYFVIKLVVAVAAYGAIAVALVMLVSEPEANARALGMVIAYGTIFLLIFFSATDC